MRCNVFFNTAKYPGEVILMICIWLIAVGFLLEIRWFQDNHRRFYWFLSPVMFLLTGVIVAMESVIPFLNSAYLSGCATLVIAMGICAVGINDFVAKSHKYKRYMLRQHTRRNFLQFVAEFLQPFWVPLFFIYKKLVDPVLLKLKAMSQLQETKS